jgi:dihydropteroate synthase
MGILNVTPDSFSDGGRYLAHDNASAKAEEMVREGADIIDVGGESTRPGSAPVTVQDQLQRILPVIEALRRRLPGHCLLSIDTTYSEVARAALDAGANMINDISAGRDDPALFALAAERSVPIIIMHMQGTPKTMQDDPRYESVVDEVLSFLLWRAAVAESSGIRAENIVIDPGIGFGKRRNDNLLLMAALKRFVDSGYPVLLGTSRKRFMGAVCNVTEPSELVAATTATTALGVMAGVRIFRVHDVCENRQAADVAYAIRSVGGSVSTPASG